MRLCLIVSLLSCVISAFAAIEPDPQEAWGTASDQNASVYASIQSARRIVSGTCVELPVYADCILAEPVSPDDWNAASFSHATLTIGGETVAMPGIEPGMKDYVRTVRFASNHFAHGAALPVKYQAWYLLSRPGPSGPIESVLGSGELEFVLTAHNSAFIYGTSVDSHSLPLQEGWPNHNSIQIELNSAHQALGVGQYRLVPARDLAQSQTKEQILSAVPAQTALYAGTHGEPTGVYDSAPPEPIGTPYRNPEDFVSLMDIAQVVEQKGPLPLFDFVALYGCSTAAIPNVLFHAFFRTENLAVRMVFGFNADIDSRAFARAKDGDMFLELWNSDKANRRVLGDQAHLLLDALSKGAPADVAYQDANAKVKSIEIAPEFTFNWPIVLAPLRSFGGGMARLKYVYLTDEEWTQDLGVAPGNYEDGRVKIWYFVK